MGLKVNKLHRRSFRLEGFDYSQNGVYFVTICTYNHQFIFGEVFRSEMQLNQCGLIVDKCWREISTHFRDVAADMSEWVVMPNHIHGIIVIDVGARHASPLRSTDGQKNQSLGVIIGSFKSAVTRKINILRKTPGAAVWQRNYYEHIIRNETEWESILNYKKTNPVRWAEDQKNPG